MKKAPESDPMLWYMRVWSGQLFQVYFCRFVTLTAYVDPLGRIRYLYACCRIVIYRSVCIVRVCSGYAGYAGLRYGYFNSRCEQIDCNVVIAGIGYVPLQVSALVYAFMATK